MKHHLLAALTLLFAGAGVLVATEPLTMIVFGDSITAGGALAANERDSVWVRVVERESKGRLRMVNEGKGGRPTDSVKEFEAKLAP